MKKILNLSFMILLVAGMAVLAAFTDREHNSRAYRSFRIEVLNSPEQPLITLEEIREIVKTNFGEIEGAPIAGIDLADLENTVSANPYVSSCEVFQTIGGGLVMLTRVREPLVRIVNRDGQQFYLDHNGWAMPLTSAHPTLVPVANGKIADRFVSLDKSERPPGSFPDSSVVHQIYAVAFHISGDEFLHSFIDQIYVNDKKEIELVPKIGSQAIILGDGTEPKEKLENLSVFYQKVMSRTDWELYKTINLKYKNQVVCSK